MQRVLQIYGIGDNDSLELVREKVATTPMGFPIDVHTRVVGAIEALLAVGSESDRPQLQGEALKKEVYEAFHSTGRAFPQGIDRRSKLPGLQGNARPSPSGRRLVILRRTLKGTFGVLRVSPDSSAIVARVDQGQAIAGPICAATQRWIINVAVRRYSIRRASLSLSFWARMWSILIPTWGCLSS